ncbi:hypothetical protein [uncultured Anaerovibrio sp.]|uniref:hypothetical protein n=1 Tax=uncultured Anaerovibrio sp. TaxID=361586 RepID=UPI00262FBC0F|nr:hypothetical protein [uncultured Anaerovibrio sp.]
MGKQDFISKFFFFVENSKGMLPLAKAVYMQLCYEWLSTGDEWMNIGINDLKEAVGGTQFELFAALTILERVRFIRTKKAANKNFIEIQIQ